MMAMNEIRRLDCNMQKINVLSSTNIAKNLILEIRAFWDQLTIYIPDFGSDIPESIMYMYLVFIGLN